MGSSPLFSDLDTIRIVFIPFGYNCRMPVKDVDGSGVKSEFVEDEADVYICEIVRFDVSIPVRSVSLTYTTIPISDNIDELIPNES